MTLAVLEHDLTGIDFAQSEVTASVRRIRRVGDDGTFVILDTDTGKSLTGEIDAPDEISAGVAYRFFGRWEVHDTYGPQFRFDSFITAATQTQMGVVAYLSRSSLGLTRSDAARLWKAFGADAIATLRDSPNEVIMALECDNAKAVKMQDASQLLTEDEKDGPIKIALFELFANRGFPKNTIKACIATWGAKAPVVIRRNPFALLVRDIPGVGFKRADKLYLDLGGNPLRLKRQTLAAWHQIRTASTGNTWEANNVLFKGVLQATGSIAASDFDRAVELGVRAKWLARRVEIDPAALARWTWDGGPRPEPATYYAERANAAAEERLAIKVREMLS